MSPIDDVRDEVAGMLSEEETEMRPLFLLTAMAVCAVVNSAPAYAGLFKLDCGLQSTDPQEDAPSYGVQNDPDGNLYVSGYWNGGSSSTRSDFFLSKYTGDGNPIWRITETRGYFEYVQGMKVDRWGNSHVYGYADGPSGGSYYGWRDGFIRKYDTNGSLLWQDQVGTESYDTWLALSVDAGGNAVVGGQTHGTLVPGTPGTRPDTTVAKYDSAGNRQWTKQYDVGGHDTAGAPTILSDASGNSYMVGGVDSSQHYLMKLASDGSRVWTREIGLPGQDESIILTGFDAQGRIVFAGETLGALAGTHYGGWDVYVGRCDPDGNIEWIGQYGTANDDRAYVGVLDSSGNITWVGFTDGSWFGDNQGSYDAYIAQIAADGTLLGGTQFGTAGRDVLSGLCTNGSEYWVSGNTTGSLWGAHAGGYDMILGRLSLDTLPVPAPGAALLGILGLGYSAWRLKRGSC